MAMPPIVASAGSGYPLSAAQRVVEQSSTPTHSDATGNRPTLAMMEAGDAALDEGFWSCVALVEIAIDGSLQAGDRVKAAATNALAGESQD